MTRVLGFTVLVILLFAGSEALLHDRKPATSGEAAKEYAKEVVRDTADATKNAGNAIKQTANAAYESTADAAKTVTGGRKDATSTGTTGAAYRDSAGRYVEDSATTTQSKAADAAGAVKKFAERTTETAADTARAAAEKASQGATATKDAAVDTAQAAWDKAAEAYDATADKVGGTSNKDSDTPRNIKDQVWGQPDSEKTYTQSASETAEAAGDAARRAGQNVKDSASRAYDSTTNTLGTPVRDQGRDQGVLDKAGEYFQDAKHNVNNAAEATKDAAMRAGQATRDTTYKTMGYEAPSDQGYGSRAYESARDASASAYETGKEKLGNIIEVLGWRKAAEHEHNSRSPYDVLVGNTRYVWHQTPSSEDSYYQKAKDTLSGATDTTSSKAGQAANTASDMATRAKDRTMDAANQAAESIGDVTGRANDAMKDTAQRAKGAVTDMTGETGKTTSDYQRRAKEAFGAGAAAVGAHKLSARSGRFRKALRFLQLLTYAVTFGSAIWMTFISGRILSRTIPREQFRNVQTKMFPYYLKSLVAGESALALLSVLTRGSSKWSLLGFVLLIGSAAYNAFVLEPKTTKVYHERLRVEKEEGRGLHTSSDLPEKQKKFNEVHGFSAILNLLSVAGLTYHGWNIVSELVAH
jgi:hypothetical protein